MKTILIVLTLAASTPALAGQQSQQAGFWKKKGPTIHNTNIGNVGIGTTSPEAKLDVAGTARVKALDIGYTGSIYKGGALFIHTKGGANNTALGEDALARVTTGFGNTASGERALHSNTTGFGNTANGRLALYYNTTGFENTASGAGTLFYNTTGNSNTASGAGALSSNTTGSDNTACGAIALISNATGHSNTASGYRALGYNTTGYSNTASGAKTLAANTTGFANTASGFRVLESNTTGFSNTASGAHALFYNTTGRGNIAIGAAAGANLTTGDNNIAIGSPGLAADSSTIRLGGVQTRAFIAGIHGKTTANANAIPVLIDSAGQLGTISSSRRFKEDIRDMGEATERLMDLRAVLFRYKGRDDDSVEFGLIAEEVAEVFPELVVYDGEGRPETVRYHLLGTMLLNELQKEHERVDALQAWVESQAEELEALRTRMPEFECR